MNDFPDLVEGMLLYHQGNALSQLRVFDHQCLWLLTRRVFKFEKKWTHASGKSCVTTLILFCWITAPFLQSYFRRARLVINVARLVVATFTDEHRQLFHRRGRTENWKSSTDSTIGPSICLSGRVWVCRGEGQIPLMEETLICTIEMWQCNALTWKMYNYIVLIDIAMIMCAYS